MKTIFTFLLAFIANFTLQAQSLDDGMDATVQADSVSQATVQADFVSLPSDSLPWPYNVKARLENIIFSSPLLSTSNIGV